VNGWPASGRRLPPASSGSPWWTSLSFPQSCAPGRRGSAAISGLLLFQLSAAQADKRDAGKRVRIIGRPHRGSALARRWRSSAWRQLDESIAGQVHRRMAHPESARRFSARHYDASQMTHLLRSLNLLITSRFHAAVLSLAAGVPQVAIHHDTRLATLYQDLGLKDKWFMDPGLTGEPESNVYQPEFFAGIRNG